MARNVIAENPESPQAIGKRLRSLRRAEKLSQDDIAHSIGMASGSASWSPYEKGKDMIPANNALALCRRYYVTMDWIYRGLGFAGLSHDLAEKIRFQELRDEEADKPPSRRS